MIVIRLARIGRKNKPYYRLVLQDKKWSPSSKSLEILGTYNPHTKPGTAVLKTDRIKYWLGQGAQPSETVHNMLVNAKIINAPKKKVVCGHAKKVEAKKVETAPTGVKPGADKK